MDNNTNEVGAAGTLFYEAPGTSTWTDGKGWLRFFGDQMKWEVGPAPAMKGSGIFRGFEGLKKALRVEKLTTKKVNGALYSEIPLEPGRDGRFFNGGGDNSNAKYEVVLNTMRYLRQRAVGLGLYPEDAPLGYRGMDNFVDPRLLEGGLEEPYRQQFEWLAGSVVRQLAEAQRFMKAAVGRDADDTVLLSSAEFVHDRRVLDPHLALVALKPQFQALSSGVEKDDDRPEGYHGWDRGSSSLKVFGREYNVTAYSKTPTLLRFQIKLHRAGIREFLAGSLAAPLTPECWAHLFAAIEERFTPLLLPMVKEVEAGQLARAPLADFLAVLTKVTGAAEDLAQAQEFLDALLGNQVVVNDQRRFKQLVIRGKDAGLLIMDGKSRWALAPQYHDAARRVMIGFQS